MKYKAFLITLNSNQWTAYQSELFHKKFTNLGGIISWWHHLSSTYIILTNAEVTSNRVQKAVKSLTNNKHFFVIEIDFDDYNGWLPQDAWNWIRDVKQKYLKNSSPFS